MKPALLIVGGMVAGATLGKLRMRFVIRGQLHGNRAESSPDHTKKLCDGTGTVPGGSGRFRVIGGSGEPVRTSWSVWGAPGVFGRGTEAPATILRHPRRPAAASGEAEVMHFFGRKILMHFLSP